MKIGRITSLTNGPERDVEVRIASDELFSAISNPAGVIKGSEVVGLEVAEEKTGATFSFPDYSFRLFMRLSNGHRVLFYQGATRFDLALMLDEIEAAIPNVPRSRTQA